MDIHSFTPTTSKQEVFEAIKSQLETQTLSLAEIDIDRPWGGFIRLKDADVSKFKEIYFSEVDFTAIPPSTNLSPKILFVAPGKRLSWQYHHRRKEIWHVICGPIKTTLSSTDEEAVTKEYQTGDLIKIEYGVRHRLIGAENWGVVAEIWHHTDPNNPSDEQDIVRLQDDFGRN
jgi:mannose-6-phosphate isomerase